MDNGLVRGNLAIRQVAMGVLILIVVDNGLVPPLDRLQWAQQQCLNPYCSGQWSRTGIVVSNVNGVINVLILIVVDNGLVPFDGFAQQVDAASLNPYCSGQWSRTRPYKTLLIINKLKNFAKETFTFLNQKLTIS